MAGHGQYPALLISVMQANIIRAQDMLRYCLDIGIGRS